MLSKSIIVNAKKSAVGLLALVSLCGAGLSTSVNASHVHQPRTVRRVHRARHHKLPRYARRYNMMRLASRNRVMRPARRMSRVMPKRARHIKRTSSKLGRMMQIAHAKLGDSYVYGATGPSVFDCSGFTKYVYAHGANKEIPRTAQAQYEAGRHISESHAKAGDLVFFGSSTANIGHVGMYLGHGQMVDAQLRGVIVEPVHAPWWHAVGFARL